MPTNDAAEIRSDQTRAGSLLKNLGLNFILKDHCRTKVLGTCCLFLPDCSGCLCGCCLSISHSSPGREGWAHQYLCYRPGAEGLTDSEPLAYQRRSLSNPRAGVSQRFVLLLSWNVYPTNVPAEDPVQEHSCSSLGCLRCGLRAPSSRRSWGWEGALNTKEANIFLISQSTLLSALALPPRKCPCRRSSPDQNRLGMLTRQSL